jgi:hypothetical protein
MYTKISTSIVALLEFLNMRVLNLLPVLFGVPSFGVLISRQFPHLIIPVDANNPNTAYGTQKIANITQTVTHHPGT